ncbi:MAG: hypothetical protein LBH12_00265 [Dysgonamonadaceae bacterium]|jgi:tetratricopeptide (TPR) repeat protein|nr:hypothetical protein [Dysgonamonadaceae bacterium]
MKQLLIVILIGLNLIACTQSAKEKRLKATAKRTEALNLYSRSLITMNLNDSVIQQVIDLLDESIAIDEEYALSYFSKAGMLSKLNKNEEGVNVLTSGLKAIKKDDVDLLTLRAILYERLGNDDLAKQDYTSLKQLFDKILDKEPNSFYALSNRAVIVSLDEDKEKGLAELNKIDPNRLNEKESIQFRFLEKTLANDTRSEIIEKIDM